MPRERTVEGGVTAQKAGFDCGSGCAVGKPPAQERRDWISGKDGGPDDPGQDSDCGRQKQCSPVCESPARSRGAEYKTEGRDCDPSERGLNRIAESGIQAREKE